MIKFTAVIDPRDVAAQVNELDVIPRGQITDGFFSPVGMPTGLGQNDIQTAA